MMGGWLENKIDKKIKIRQNEKDNLQDICMPSEYLLRRIKNVGCGKERGRESRMNKKVQST